MRGRPASVWTPERVALLRQLYPDRPTREVAAALGVTLASCQYQAGRFGLRKAPEYLRSVQLASIRRNAVPFQPGDPPWNKGLSGYPCPQPNHRRYQEGAPVGYEFLNQEGYRMRKITDINGQGHRNYAMVHRLIWEEHHGPIPPDQIVVFINGDKSDIRLDNLELITRRELIARNSSHNLPPELDQLVQLKGQLTRALNRRTKKS